MWKNQTTPNLHTQLNNPSTKNEQKNISNVCQLSFSQIQAKQQHLSKKQLSKLTIPMSTQNRSQHQIAQQFMSRQSCSFDSKLDEKSSCISNCKNVSKEAFILMELEQNQQLRINLFRAEKTILDLDTMCKVMHNKIVEIITNKKNQMENKLGTAENSLSKSMKQETSGKKTRKNKENQWQKISVGQKKQEEITEIWKSCYSDLIEYITKYTKDITYLTEQYRALQAKTQHYKKTEKKNKRNQKHLLKILHESSVKLQKSEQTANKLIQDLKDRDVKIEQYHIENKNLKMKILENLQQIERIRRDNKLNIRDSANYKEAYKSIQDEVSIQKKKLKDLLSQMQNKQKLIQIHKNNEKMLQQRNILLEEQLNESKKFSENLMQQYKNLTHKIDSNQQKISQKYQAAENMYEQRTKQYERYIQNIKKQREIMQQKNQLKFQKLQEELQKCKVIQTSLQKQLCQRSNMIMQLQQEAKQKSQKFANLEVDLQVHLNQKDRQIEYLEELRDIGLQKNEELKSQLQEVRGDMLLIIEQLKIKQLQVQKYKSYTDSSFTSEKKIIKKYSLKTLNNVIENPNFNSNSKTYMNKKNQINKLQADIETNPSKDKMYNKCVESVDNRKRLKITPIEPIIIQENISAPETLIKNSFQIHNYDTVNNINSLYVNSSANNQSNNTKKKSQKNIQGIIWKKRNKISEISQSFGQEPEQQPESYPALDVQPEQQYTHYEDTNQFEEYQQCNQFEGLQQFEELNEQINEFIPHSSHQVTWENPVKRVNLNQIIIDDFQNDPMELQTPKIWKNSSPNGLSFGLDPKQQKFFQKQQLDQKKQNNLQKCQGIKVKNQTARSKFSLQNFQNKIMMQENAKLLLSMNNISFR